MIMTFFSALHILTVLLEVGVVFVLYRLFRDRSAWAKRAVIIVLMSLNILQHFFKHFLYPHLTGIGFGLDNTLYNVCAFLILFSPLMHFGKSGSARQGIAYIGSIAGLVAVCFPFWFIGEDITAPEILSEYIRFWLCHMLLFASSVLPILWRGITFRYLDGWKFALYFLGMLCVLLLNNTIVLIATGEATPSTLYGALLNHNPIGIMGPPEGNALFGALAEVVRVLTPPVFFGGGGKLFTPILWFAFPLGYAVTIAGTVLGMIADRANFVADMKLLFLRKGTPPARKRLTRRAYGYDPDCTVF